MTRSDPSEHSTSINPEEIQSSKISKSNEVPPNETDSTKVLIKRTQVFHGEEKGPATGTGATQVVHAAPQVIGSAVVKTTDMAPQVIGSAVVKTTDMASQVNGSAVVKTTDMTSQVNGSAVVKTTDIADKCWLEWIEPETER